MKNKSIQTEYTLYMNIKAKFYTLGTVRELLHTQLEYNRYFNPKTGRCGEEPMGGILTLSFMAGHEDDRLQRWIIKRRKGELCTLTQCKVVFYKGSFNGVVFLEYKFNDSALVSWHESFSTNGESPMIITLKISSAIHEIRGVTHVKHWQESYIPPSRQMPYRAAEVAEGGPEITESYYEDLQGNTIPKRKLKTGDEIYYILKTKNATGKQATIDLANNALDYEYNGAILQGDLLTVTVTADTMRLSLKAITQQTQN